MLTLTYEYKLIPTAQQIGAIEHTLAVCHSVWNYALRERKDWLNSRKSPLNACSLKKEYIIPADAPFPNYHYQSKQLTEAKKTNPILKSVNAQVLQQVLRTLDRAFMDMRSKGLGFPRFKNPYRMRSFVYSQMLEDCVKGDAIKLPQLGWLNFRKSRDIPEVFKVKQARIIRKASGYFIALSLELDVKVPQPFPHGHPRGLDLGFDKFVATSDGEEIKRPRFLKTLRRQLKLLQRRLNKKQKGSKNRQKLNQKIARLHPEASGHVPLEKRCQKPPQRISDTRRDWHFKLAHHLCDGAGMIFTEDINFTSWQRGMLSKHSADAGFGQFVTILQWVCWKQDICFAKVNKDGTSQECPECGTNSGKKTLDVRVHSCSECGYTTSRDVAAAQIIRNRGLSEVGLTLDIKENACGDGLTGAKVTLSSQESAKQENLIVRLGISRQIKDSVGRRCQSNHLDVSDSIQQLPR